MEQIILFKYFESHNEILANLKKYFHMNDTEKAEDLLYISDCFRKLKKQLNIKYDFFTDIPNNIQKEIIEKVAKNLEHYTNQVEDVVTAPSWMSMDYIRDINDQWLIHFSDDAEQIYNHGFTKGVIDASQLALTKYNNYDEDEYQKEKYCFAFNTMDKDYAFYGERYGKKAILFKASGIEVYHHGDGYKQVVFVYTTAHDEFLLEKYYGEWYHGSDETDGYDIKELVDKLKMNA